MSIRQKLTILILLISAPAFAGQNSSTGNAVPFGTVFHQVGRNLKGSFTDRNGLNYYLAIGGSLFLIAGGVDKAWNDFSHDHSVVSSAGFVSVGAGGLVPIAVPLGLYLYGHGTGNHDLQITGLALGQAAILGGVISSGIKAITGRMPPPDSNEPKGSLSRSQDFHFGFLRRGAFEGWPSSHAMIAFAMGTTLRELYPDNRTVQVVSWVYPSLIALGVSTNIHWLSDAVAGSLIGYSIGKTVGSSFRGLMAGQMRMHSNTGAAFQLYPTADGVSLSYIF